MIMKMKRMRKEGRFEIDTHDTEDDEETVPFFPLTHTAVCLCLKKPVNRQETNRITNIYTVAYIVLETDVNVMCRQ